MENNWSNFENESVFSQHEVKSQTAEFFKKVYAYMGLALLVSGGVAYYLGTDIDLFARLFVNASGEGMSPLFYVVTFAPVGFAFLIPMMQNRLSLGGLMLLFFAFAALMGASLSSIFMVYSMSTLATTFFVTAGAFGGMAILGYTTKTDLSKFGSLLYMLFIGIFIASIVNFFMKSGALSWGISFLGIFVFTGLTAYWMQQLKGAAMLQGVERDKMALIGGLNLYLLFINLFLSLLRIFGGGRD